jgi:hypothetical protein
MTRKRLFERAIEVLLSLNFRKTHREKRTNFETRSCGWKQTRKGWSSSWRLWLSHRVTWLILQHIMQPLQQLLPKHMRPTRVLTWQGIQAWLCGNGCHLLQLILLKIMFLGPQLPKPLLSDSFLSFSSSFRRIVLESKKYRLQLGHFSVCQGYLLFVLLSDEWSGPLTIFRDVECNCKCCFCGILHFIGCQVGWDSRICWDCRTRHPSSTSTNEYSISYTISWTRVFLKDIWPCSLWPLDRSKRLYKRSPIMK